MDKGDSLVEPELCLLSAGGNREVNGPYIIPRDRGMPGTVQECKVEGGRSFRINLLE